MKTNSLKETSAAKSRKYDAASLTNIVSDTLKEKHDYELPEDVKQHVKIYWEREDSEMYDHGCAVFLANEIFETAEKNGLAKKFTPETFWAQDFMTMFCIENQFDPFTWNEVKRRAEKCKKKRTSDLLKEGKFVPMPTPEEQEMAPPLEIGISDGDW